MRQRPLKRISEKTLRFYVLLVLIGFFGACKKNNAPSFLRPAKGTTTDTATSVIKLLAKSNPVFFAALRRLHLDTTFSIHSPYTIFAPTDSAMSVAGLNAAGVNRISVDSLTALVSYLVVNGVYKDSALSLTQGNTSAETRYLPGIVSPPNGYGIEHHPLYVDFKRVITIDGNSVNKGEPSNTASNGVIYRLDTVIYPAAQTVYQLIKHQPELSDFFYMIHVTDSLYKMINQGAGQPVYSLDSTFMNANLPVEYQLLPTINYQAVVAPNNNAYKKAGFLTLQSIKDYALLTTPGPAPVLPCCGITGYYNTDSIFWYHILYPGVRYGVPHDKLFYNDLYEINTTINSNPYNETLLGYNRGGGFSYIDSLAFIANGKNVRVQSRFDIGNIVPFLYHGSTTYNINALNGVVFETDQLFRNVPSN